MGLWLTRGVSLRALSACSNHLSPEAYERAGEESFNGYVFILGKDSATMSFKQAILVRQDLQLPKGKMAAQAAHAAVEAALRASKTDMDAWRREGMAKIVLKVADEKELYKYIQEAKDEGLATAIISDAGHTVVEPGTVTCGAIGPADEDAVDAIISALKLM
jgi:PTH2 family peptidyl-tRNA hydrolase